MSPSTDLRENREFASEIKFLLDPPTAERVRDWAEERLAPDPNAGGGSGDSYLITSLYFDTPDYDVFHRRGSFGRSKYRVRRYGEGAEVFLERKLKTRGLLAKRRSMLDHGELPLLSRETVARDWSGRWFHRRVSVRSLRPVCQISYRRQARVMMTSSGPIRLTLDAPILARPVGGIAFQPIGGGIRLAPDQVILELKFRRDLPVLFKELVETFRLSLAPFSKYSAAVAALGLVDVPTEVAAATDDSDDKIVCLTS